MHAPSSTNHQDHQKAEACEECLPRSLCPLGRRYAAWPRLRVNSHQSLNRVGNAHEAASKMQEDHRCSLLLLVCFRVGMVGLRLLGLKVVRRPSRSNCKKL